MVLRIARKNFCEINYKAKINLAFNLVLLHLVFSITYNNGKKSSCKRD